MLIESEELKKWIEEHIEPIWHRNAWNYKKMLYVTSLLNKIKQLEDNNVNSRNNTK